MLEIQNARIAVEAAIAAMHEHDGLIPQLKWATPVGDLPENRADAPAKTVEVRVSWNCAMDEWLGARQILMSLGTTG